MRKETSLFGLTRSQMSNWFNLPRFNKFVVCNHCFKTRTKPVGRIGLTENRRDVWFGLDNILYMQENQCAPL